MRALILHDYASGQLHEQQVERPEPEAHQVLVRVIASGVNPVDYKIRAGMFPATMPQPPAILGADAAGIVEAVGSAVNRFAVGDAVYGLVGGVRGLPGSLAEFTAVDADLLALKPEPIDFRQAAAMPLVFLTAWSGLVDKAKVQAGQRVLVLGGAGGVGHMAVQIARAFGAQVFATASPGKHSIVEGYGATAIDYHTTSVSEYVEQYTRGEGFDIIFDTVGGQCLTDAFQAIRHHGHIASCAAYGTHDLAACAQRAATLSAVFVLLPLLSGQGRAHYAEVLAHAARLVEAGQLKPLLDPQRYTLGDVDAAHHAVQHNTAVGKVVIDIA